TPTVRVLSPRVLVLLRVDEPLLDPVLRACAARAPAVAVERHGRLPLARRGDAERAGQHDEPREQRDDQPDAHHSTAGGAPIGSAGLPVVSPRRRSPRRRMYSARITRPNEITIITAAGGSRRGSCSTKRSDW